MDHYNYDDNDDKMQQNRTAPEQNHEQPNETEQNNYSNNNQQYSNGSDNNNNDNDNNSYNNGYNNNYNNNYNNGYNNNYNNGYNNNNFNNGYNAGMKNNNLRYQNQPNVYATLSLIFGVLSIFLVLTVWGSMFTGIAAIVLAIVSKINSGKGVPMNGRAIAGLTMGIIFLLISILFIAAFIYILQNPDLMQQYQNIYEQLEEQQNVIMIFRGR